MLIYQGKSVVHRCTFSVCKSHFDKVTFTESWLGATLFYLVSHASNGFASSDLVLTIINVLTGKEPSMKRPLLTLIFSLSQG